MFSQEESEAGLMTEVFPLKKEIQVGTETLSGLWFDPDNTSGPVLDTRSCLLELSIYNGSQGRNSHRRHTLEHCLASWFLAKKSEEGNKAIFSHWPRVETLQPRHEFRCGACQRPKLARKQFLRVRCLKSVAFIGSGEIH